MQELVVPSLSREGFGRCESLGVTSGASLGVPHPCPRPLSAGDFAGLIRAARGPPYFTPRVWHLVLCNRWRTTAAAPPSWIRGFRPEGSVTSRSLASSCPALPGARCLLYLCAPRPGGRRSPSVSHLVSAIGPAVGRWRGARVEVTLILLIVAPERGRRGAGDPGVPSSSWQGLRFSGKVSTYREKHSVRGGRCHLWFQAPPERTPCRKGGKDCA